MTRPYHRLRPITENQGTGPYVVGALLSTKAGEDS